MARTAACDASAMGQGIRADRPLPADSLLATYAQQRAYTDCYTTDVAGSVSLAEYVETFYTGRLFRIERWLLGVVVAKRSTDAELRELAQGIRHEFSAWRVEARTDEQLLMCDLAGRTRSWFRVAPGESRRTTRLYFGSAVVPTVDPQTGRARMGAVFRLLLGIHRLYSRALLASARGRLARARD